MSENKRKTNPSTDSVSHDKPVNVSSSLWRNLLLRQSWIQSIKSENIKRNHVKHYNKVLSL